MELKSHPPHRGVPDGSRRWIPSGDPYQVILNPTRSVQIGSSETMILVFAEGLVRPFCSQTRDSPEQPNGSNAAKHFGKPSEADAGRIQ